MHGAGNDFVVFDATVQPLVLGREQLKRIADRHLGVGCDQILVVEKPHAAGADFRYRIFNADGGEVEQCGNGARCFVKFVHDKGLSSKREIDDSPVIHLNWLGCTYRFVAWPVPVPFRHRVRVPAHDGHDSEPMADTVPTAWRTVFRWHGGQFGGRIGTLSAMIS